MGQPTMNSIQLLKKEKEQGSSSMKHSEVEPLHKKIRQSTDSIKNSLPLMYFLKKWGKANTYLWSYMQWTALEGYIRS